jgi:hypothetical protein
VNWTRILLAGVVAGIVTNVADFVMHGMVMANTYMKYPQVFTQTQANPLWFLLVALCLGISAAILFGKTRTSWAAGWAGGATFGFFLGLVGFWPGFYHALTIDGFPYYLSWCWGGITMIDAVLAGSVLGSIIKRT